MNDLNFLCDIVEKADVLRVKPEDYLNLVELQVTKYMKRDKNYQGRYLTPNKNLYDRAIKVVERYYRRSL